MAKPERRRTRRERPPRPFRPRGRPKRAFIDHPARYRLLRVAARLFAARGFAAASVAEIVAAAGVTKPVLYYHFHSKEGLFRGLVEEAGRLLGGALARVRVGRQGARERIKALFTELFDLFVANLDLARFLDVVMYGPPEGVPAVDLELLHDSIRDGIRRILLDGRYRGEFIGRSDDLLWGLLGILRITTETTLHHPKHSPGRAGMLRLVDRLFDGSLDRTGKKSPRR